MKKLGLTLTARTEKILTKTQAIMMHCFTAQQQTSQNFGLLYLKLSATFNEFSLKF